MCVLTFRSKLGEQNDGIEGFVEFFRRILPQVGETLSLPFATSSHLLSNHTSLPHALRLYLPCYVGLHMYLYLSHIPIVRFEDSTKSLHWPGGPWSSNARLRS